MGNETGKPHITRTSMAAHAAREIEAAGLSGAVVDAAVSLLRELESRGLSRNDSAAAADLVWKLAHLRNLAPLGDGPGDWETDPDEPGVSRHARCPDLVRLGDGPAVYTRALAFRDPDGRVWHGECWAGPDRSARVSSSLEVAGFPFWPRTLVLDVVRVPVGENAVDDFLADPAALAMAAPTYRVPGF